MDDKNVGIEVFNLGPVVRNWHQPLLSIEHISAGRHAFPIRDVSIVERSAAHLFRCSLRYKKNARRRLRHKTQSKPRRFPSCASGMVVGVNPHVWE